MTDILRIDQQFNDRDKPSLKITYDNGVVLDSRESGVSEQVARDLNRQMGGNSVGVAHGELVRVAGEGVDRATVRLDLVSLNQGISASLGDKATAVLMQSDNGALVLIDKGGAATSYRADGYTREGDKPLSELKSDLKAKFPQLDTSESGPLHNRGAIMMKSPDGINQAIDAASGRIPTVVDAEYDFAQSFYTAKLSDGREVRYATYNYVDGVYTPNPGNKMQDFADRLNQENPGLNAAANGAGIRVEGVEGRAGGYLDGTQLKDAIQNIKEGGSAAGVSQGEALILGNAFGAMLTPLTANAGLYADKLGITPQAPAIPKPEVNQQRALTDAATGIAAVMSPLIEQTAKAADAIAELPGINEAAKAFAKNISAAMNLSNEGLGGQSPAAAQGQQPPAPAVQEGRGGPLNKFAPVVSGRDTSRH